MLPYLKGDKVIVPDRKMASTLINKGNFGKPMKGGGLELTILEAAYLVGCQRLEVKSSRV
jgi:tRNA-intron endonuclease